MPGPVIEVGAVDYWEVLGLEPGADAALLKRAFRDQARRWHPDLNANDPAAEERFKRINEAYAVLSDPRRRQAWEAGEHSASGQSDPFASGFPDFDTYLAVLFGRSRPQQPNAEKTWAEDRGEETEDPPWPSTGSRGGGVTPSTPPVPPVQASADLETTVELSPDQALSGARVELELADGTCVEVWTPPQAGDGWRLQLAGVAPGGRDHFLQLRVRTPEGLRIDGLRVLYQLEISPAAAVLGCSAVVPTLDGPVRLRVPPGSSSGRLLRLRGRGQELDEQRGDQLVELRLVVPEVPSAAQEALYRRLLELDRDEIGVEADSDPDAG